jgi:cupin superfamily acireductone dioxygenase involved in methionine salvage
MQIPKEISGYFKTENFQNYPKISIPQQFQDERGFILNLADGSLGDVALITSKPNTYRASHVHKEDWHLCYLLSGKILYEWKDPDGLGEVYSAEINVGELLFTPPGTPHRMYFSEESHFVAISKLSRISENYEMDTSRLPSNFFMK